MAPPTNWEADRMLNMYINDYFLKRNLKSTAQIFQSESSISTDSVAIDSPDGFLWEWWSVFWDVFVSRYAEQSSDFASPSTEQQQQQQQVPQQQMPHQQQRGKRKQEPQISVLGHGQQQMLQQQSMSNTVNVRSRKSPAKKSKSANANTSAFKIYEEGFNLPVFPDPTIEALMKGKRSEVTTVPKAPCYNESSLQAAGLNQGSSCLALKGWPLAGLEQLHERRGVYPTQNSSIKPCMSGHQFQMQQQQRMLQPQKLASASDLEAHKLRMLNNCHLTLGRNYSLSNTNDVLHNTGSTLQYGCQNQHIRKIDELLMQQQQMVNNNYIQQLCMKNSLLSQLSQSPSLFHDQGHIKPSEFFAATDHLSSSFTEIDQGAQYEELENQKLSAFSPGRSSEVANALAPSSSNISTHTARSLGDNVVSSLVVPCHGNSCKALVVFGADPNDSLTLDTSEKAGDHFQDNRSLEDKVGCYMPHEGSDIENQVDRVGDRSKDSSLTEIKLLRSSSIAAIECCHFSSDGELLVTGDSEKKAILWRMESFSKMSKLDEHMHSITDVRFSSSMPRLATSSVDGIVRVWSVNNANRHNTDNIEYPICTFTGHSSAVMSLDFHPCRNNLLCSCDNNSEIRYWSIRNSCCAGVFKGGANHIRFQPRYGRFLAAAMDNNVSLLDVETQICRQKLQGHKSMITNVCWDPNGDYLASVSNDLVRVWKMGAKAECVQELISGGSEFHTCVFHPTQPCSLILASYKSMEIWDMVEKRKVMNVHAHEGLISSLAASTSTGFIASASHDGLVKIWK